MIGENDWRLELGPMVGNADSIKNIALYRIPFTPLSDKLDHEHCIFCWAKFFLHPEYLQEGYCTSPENARDAHWICPECYEDFKDRFCWKVRD